MVGLILTRIWTEFVRAFKSYFHPHWGGGDLISYMLRCSKYMSTKDHGINRRVLMIKQCLLPYRCLISI